MFRDIATFLIGNAIRRANDFHRGMNGMAPVPPLSEDFSVDSTPQRHGATRCKGHHLPGGRRELGRIALATDQRGAASTFLNLEIISDIDSTWPAHVLINFKRGNHIAKYRLHAALGDACLAIESNSRGRCSVTPNHFGSTQGGAVGPAEAWRSISPSPTRETPH